MNLARRPVVGVTGLPCSGKSFVARLLASGEVTGEPGLAVKADAVGHQVLNESEVAAKLAERFGAGILDAEGKPERRKIAAAVFSNPDALRWLEGLLHPRIDRVIAGMIAAAGGSRPLIVEAALLFAAGMEKRCDIVLVVEADREARLRRAADRGWSEEELTRRENRLLPLFAKVREEGCGTRCETIDNNGKNGLDGLKARLAEALVAVMDMKGQP
ncbi:MAG: dephospho-CoA kinase [Planctomycetota bacterium]|jgi:dephospho-CoA kinase|nr:dephospho-CoA kinase [Planctomycetota bacterium]